MVELIGYNKCCTCSKAAKWLRDHNIEFTARSIVDDTPNSVELAEIQAKSGQPIKKLFNTCGKAYKEMNLKDKLADMSDTEKYEILADDGMLIKRPILVLDDKALIGFKVDEWEKALNVK